MLCCAISSGKIDKSEKYRMINRRSSEVSIIVGVENKDFENAIRGLYKAFKE